MTTVTDEGLQTKPAGEGAAEKLVTLKLQALESPRDLNTLGITADCVLGSTEVDKTQHQEIEGVVAYHHSAPVNPEQPDGTYADTATIFFATGSGVEDLVNYLRRYGGEDGREVDLLIDTLMERAFNSAGTAITLIEETIKFPASSAVITALAQYLDMVNGITSA